MRLGTDVAISISAIGLPPLGYQWYFNETNLIAGARFPILTLNDVQPEDSGSYRVVVSNPAGAVTSAPALLQVAPFLDVDMVPAVYLNAGVGYTCRLEYVNSLGPTGAWTYLDTVVITNQPQFYFDTSAIRKPSRFYRLIQLTP